MHARKGAAGVLQQLLLLLLLPQSKSCSGGAGGAPHCGGVFLLIPVRICYIWFSPNTNVIKVGLWGGPLIVSDRLRMHDVPKGVNFINS